MLLGGQAESVERWQVGVDQFVIPTAYALKTAHAVKQSGPPLNLPIHVVQNFDLIIHNNLEYTTIWHEYNLA